MGADAIAHVVSLISGCDWFAVRKEAKKHGKQRLIEGADIAGSDILLVDDIVTTGGSILKALEAVKDSGATVTFATCLIDRGEAARERLHEAGVPYEPLLTYRDLGIEPVGSGRVRA